MLWSSLAWVFFTRFVPTGTSWILLLGTAASIVFSVALVFVLVARQIDLRRFGVPQGLATRWDRLVKGISSVLRGNAAIAASTIAARQAAKNAFTAAFPV